MAAPSPLSNVMQEQRQIKQARILNLIEDGAQMRALLVLTGIQLVERFDRFEGMLVYGVVMIEIVLDEQANASKLGNKTREETRFVHQSQHVAAAPTSAEEFHESPRSFKGRTEVAVHCRQTLAHGV